MSSLNIKFDSRKIQRNLENKINRIVQKENEKKVIKKNVSERGENMKLLNDTEKELLKLILESNHDGYTYSGTIEIFPEYITNQIKKLFSILEECGYAAKTYCWLNGGWQVILTPLGVNYFDKEEEYKKMSDHNNISIQNFNANGSNINFGNVYDSNFNIDYTFQELEKTIDEKANDEDKEELKCIMQEVKDYIDNINESKIVSKNTGLFKRIGKHIQNYQWFYQTLVTMIGNSIINVMGGK